MITHRLRRALQIAVLLIAVNAGLGLALGWSMGGVERFCPFGGIETLWALVTRQSFTCAMGPYNFTLMIALLASALLARKAFCAWICPVGTVHEGLGWLLRRLGLRRGGRAMGGLFTPRAGLDRALRWLRLPVLILILIFTVHTGELIFRPYDPYYVLFSAHGHDVRWWSYLVLAGILALSVLVPMAWCRYLCPLGVSLWPFARVGWLRLARDPEACTSCGRCDRACAHDLRVATEPEVRSGECTLCLDCVEACGEARALSLRPAGLRGLRVPGPAVAALVVAMTLGGLVAADLVAFPSYSRTYVAPASTSVQRVTLVIDGLRCVDTARQVAAQLDGRPGVVSLTAYAADHEAEIAYDPSAIGVAALIEAIEGPVLDERSGEFLFHLYRVIRQEDPR